MECSSKDGWSEDNQLDILKTCPGVNEPDKCLSDSITLYAGAESQSFSHPGLYDFNENIWAEGSTTPMKEYIQTNYEEQFNSIDWSMNHQACYYEIKKEITFGCLNDQKTRLNLKIDSHGKNIILYAKAGSSWENTNTWVTSPIRINGRAKDFTGDFFFDITDSEDTLVFGAIPYTTQSLKDVSADFSFQYWVECIGEEEATLNQ